MSIRFKILVSFLVASLLAAILGLTGAVSGSMATVKIATLRGTSELAHTFSGILNAHYAWRNGLTTAIISGNNFTGSLDPNTCALGQWMNSESARNMDDPTVRGLLTKLTAPHAYIHNEAALIVDMINAGDKEGAMNEFMANILPAFDTVITDLVEISNRLDGMAAELEEETHTLAKVAVNLIFALIVVVMGICVMLALSLANKVSRPLVMLSRFMENASNTGDIDIKPEDAESIRQQSTNKDEIGKTIMSSTAFINRITEISKTLTNMSNGDLTDDIKLLSDKDVFGLSLHNLYINLNNMFADIRNASEQVNNGAKQMADGAQMLAQGSTEQAATIEELSSSMSEIADKTKTNASRAEQAARLADTIKGNAEKGSRQMDEMMSAVNEINEASGSISKVIKVIDDIAFQTNILALNAAVEAARAGQHGKGFAVVAEEVRNLAAKSAEAAKDTGSLIDNSIEKASLGARIAHDTAESLTEIVSGINESNVLIGEIAQSSEEQSINIGQINEGIDQVAKVVQSNSATAQQEAAASQEMSSQSAMLQELIGQFKLKNSSGNIMLPAVPASAARRLATPADGLVHAAATDPMHLPEFTPEPTPAPARF
ncbi:MAG: methyl-accepting chemotaxis protein [Oscillospiraceae bacterium]|nr:methyl-accepting chemotaxis protein [Oscillospiraceae bacterium]